jgi:hypothetical protein
MSVLLELLGRTALFTLPVLLLVFAGRRLSPSCGGRADGSCASCARRDCGARQRS